MDKWTLAHILAGMILGAFKIPILYVIAIIIFWEIFELYMEQQRGSFLYEKESDLNRLEDILVGLCGYAFIFMIV